MGANRRSALRCHILGCGEAVAKRGVVDYVISVGGVVVPVEVKAGKTGTLKSLHLFLREKKRDFGLRLNTDMPSLLEAETSVAGGESRPFRLLSLPLYLVEQASRLSRECLRS